MPKFLTLEDDGSRGARTLPPSMMVGLGRWKVESETALIADHVFDNSLYSRYELWGQFVPVTNNVRLVATLRDGTPADVSGGVRMGGYFVGLDTTSSGFRSNVTFLTAQVGNVSGIPAIALALHMRNGDRHSMDGAYRYVAANRWAEKIHAEFVDTTLRQGIKFAFDSGNIASGSLEIIGVRRQELS